MTDRDLRLPLAARTWPAPPPAPRWYVRVLGGLALEDEHQVLHRFPGRAAALLLARLALYPARSHPREELIELLWPGVDLAVGRNRLRQALSTLKSLLEPQDGSPGAVILADRLALRAAPGALGCDATDFERHVREGRHREAAALYAGELLPGHYDDWVDDERMRLAAVHGRLPAPALEPAAPAGQPPGPDGTQHPPGRARQAQEEAPPAALPRLSAGRLPHYLSRYFGDDIALSRLRSLLAAHRLLVLIGPGGAGKTRCAVELARGWAQACASPLAQVSFVSLVDCRDAAEMAQAVASALGLSSRGDALTAVPEALEGREALLLLDNFEQLDTAADQVLGDWCQRLPALKLLVTSRRMLSTDGAVEAVAPALPPPAEGGEGGDLAALAHHPAVALFIDRARAVRPEFQLKASNRDAVVALLRELDGLPLAIELAAARLRSLPPAQLAQALARRETPSVHLDLLARPGAREASRHATMRRVIAWSWQGLPPALARRAAALSVFSGPFELAAAAALTGEDEETLAGSPSAASAASATAQEAATAAWLDELVGHSLLRALPADDEAPRYQLSVPVREYAAEQLTPAQSGVLQRRLRAWLIHWSAGWPATPPLAALRSQWPTLAAAMVGAVQAGAGDDALRLCLPLVPALTHLGLPERALSALEVALQGCSDPALAARAGAVAALLSFNAGLGDRARALAARALAQPLPADSPDRALALYAQVFVQWRGHPQPGPLRTALDHALQVATTNGDDTLAARTLLILASLAHTQQHDHEEAALLIAQALAHAQRSGNGHLQADVQYRAGIQMRLAGRPADSLAQLERVARQTRESQYWELLSACLNAQGNTLRRCRRWPEAVHTYREGIELAWQCMSLQDLGYPLWNLPFALARCGGGAHALRLLAFAAGYWEAHFDPLAASERRVLRRLRSLAAHHLGRVAVDAAWSGGESWTLAQAIEQALSTR